MGRGTPKSGFDVFRENLFSDDAYDRAVTCPGCKRLRGVLRDLLTAELGSDRWRKAHQQARHLLKDDPT